MPTFERSLVVPTPQQTLHDWHMRDGAFERLSAPWETMRHIHADPVANGSKRIFEVKKGGLWIRWVADHRDVIPGEQFTDVQEKGPFSRWEHTHRFEAMAEHRSRLVDHIEYDVPMGFIGRAFAGGSIERDVDRMFGYRHRVTLGDLTQHARFLDMPARRVAITGASGMVGKQLTAMLRTGGHEVQRFVRGADRLSDDEIRWSVDDGVRDLDRLDGVDGIIHLAGASVAQRWTEGSRREIMDSRVRGTRALVDAVGALARKPAVFISASAVGYYGDTDDEIVDEQAPAGEGFLADVCRAWEAETLRAEAHGCRTVRARIGVVMDPRGGALAKLLPVFKAGMGGRVGGGRQLVSWVGLDDVLGALLFALMSEDLDGVMNVTGPEPVTQAELAKTLGRVLSRPAIAPAPAAAIKMMYGEMGRATVLASTGARPSRLLENDYAFRTPTLESALRHCLGRGAPCVSER